MFIKKGKTNWFYVIIIALIAGAVGGISVIYVNDIMAQEGMDYADTIIYRKAPSIKTAKNVQFTGTYSFNWGENGAQGKAGGKLLVKQVSAEEIDLALSLSGSAPDFNSGKIYSGKAAISGNSAIYENNEFGNCKFEIIFDANKAVIKAVGGSSSRGLACGFGQSVDAEGVYEKINGEVPVFPKEGDPVF
ncbi:MAG TPA: hypothetical protein P5080_05580 [Candidatus Paceibacterota bacterium]|nr:hypothetical protein [Candidatus Pacearchaeota archaeon]HRZ51417.1 hypothetical protein [Candidatus Paceibacterota bacterium]HSA37139.1 hypothetical protein [Candidatus Paceibacterota bacterium]